MGNYTEITQHIALMCCYKEEPQLCNIYIVRSTIGVHRFSEQSAQYIEVMQYQFLIDALYFPSHSFFLVVVIRVLANCEPKKSFQTLFYLLVFEREHKAHMFRKWMENCNNWTHRREWIERTWTRKRGRKDNKVRMRRSSSTEWRRCCTEWMNEWERKKLSWEWKITSATEIAWGW